MTKFGFAADDKVEFHGSLTYGQYLRERLITFGSRLVIPTEGLNLRQKLSCILNKLPAPRIELQSSQHIEARL